MPILGTIASSTRQGQAVDLGAMFPLQVITVGAPVSSVTFSNIPSTYTHLQIRCLMRTTQTGDITGSYLYWQYNNDTSSIYTYHVMKGDGANATASNLTNQGVTYAERFTTAFQTPNVFGAGIIDILDYANTNKFKTHRTLAGWDNNGSGQIALNSGLWRSTSAITRIDLYPPANNFAQNSQFALYGVKSA